MKKTTFCATFLTVISAAALFAQEDRAESGRRSVPDLVQTAELKATLERGRKGSAVRRAARTFSGQPVFPVAKLGGAKQGNPGDAAAAPPADPTTILQVKSARFAVLETSGAGAATERTSASEIKNMKGATNARTDYFDPRAQMITPVDASILSPTQTFVWTSGSGVGDYFLEIGSCFECNDLVSENEGLNLSRTVPLPVDGRLIYVTLFSLIGGNWYYIDYQYQASQGPSGFPARMTSPANGATLNSRQTFVWDGGYNVDAFYLQVGTCAGCADLLDENEGQNLSRTLSIGNDGNTLFVRLYSLIQGTWWYYDYQYRDPSHVVLRVVRVNIANSLAYAVNVSVNGTLIGSCPAGTTAGKDVEVGDNLTVSFEVIQPTLNGRSLGDPMSGVFSAISNPFGTYEFSVGYQIGNTFFFQPLVTNHTSIGLEMEVNGGYQAENRCYCAAPAGATRVQFGYYSWFENSNVRLFPEGSNYTGRYIFFGIDSTGAGTSLNPFITGADAHVELIANRTP